MVKNNVSKEFLLLLISVILLDQVTKKLVLLFQPGPGFIHLVKNTGAGFGILQGKTMWLTLISLLVTLLVVGYYPKIPKEKKHQLLWGLFLGGVVGNLIDRMFRGFVIDFIDFGFWPAFNIADAAITVAVIGLIWVDWKN